MTLPPVFWSPSDLSGPDSDGHAGRLGHPIRAIVHHRVVGSLESMTNNTFKPTTDDVLVQGERRVSSHFGIGFWTLAGGAQELRIYQYVALENTAFCNGQTPRDRDACRWQLWLDAGKPPTNEITVSIEHEDNGSLGKYVVVEKIIEASIELDRLLLSGDGPAIRAAGIRCSDGAAAQLGRIIPGPQTLIDHNVIAPVSKPYCWRPIGEDKGFPQARYITALSAPTPEEPMGLAVRLFATSDNTPLDAFGTAKVKGAGHALIRVRDRAFVPVADGLDLGAVQRGELLAPLDDNPGDRTNVVALNVAGELHVALLMDVTFTLLPVPIPNCDPAVKTAVNTMLDKIIAEDVPVHKANLLARKIA